MRGPEWLKRVAKKGLSVARTPFSSEKLDTSPATASVALERLHKVHQDVGSSCIRKCPLQVSSHPTWDLDVIVPVFRAERFIRPCLDSILSQKTKYSYRVICVDDGSPDICGRILDEEYSDRPNILVIHQENRGHSGARNRALDELDSRYLTFVDSDDMLPANNVFDIMLNAGIEMGCDLVGGGYDRINENSIVISKSKQKFGAINSVSSHTGFPWGKVIRSELFSDIQFPEGYWFEDSLMRQIVYERVDKAWYVDNIVYQYRYNNESVTHTHQGKPKSIDALYVTLSLHNDRKALGIPDDDAYQDYLLHMARLIRARVGDLDEAVKRDVFTVYSAWYSAIYGGVTSKTNKVLHEALLTGDYGRYKVNLA